MRSLMILKEMEDLFPNAQCALYHSNAFELVVAVVLSAQTTDEAVNKITPHLFERFPDPETMMQADVNNIANCIKTIGLYHNKAKMLKGLSTSLVQNFHSEVPSSKKHLMSLDGVGRKTANVVQSVWFDIPAFAVDTHVERVSKRLGLAKFNDTVETVEIKLKRKLPRDTWNDAHHTFIFFGRYHCKARNPQCDECPLKTICKKDKFDAYKKNLTGIKPN